MENRDGDSINPTPIDPPVDGDVVTKGAREIYGDTLTIPIPTTSDLTPNALEKRAEDLEKHRLFLLEEAALIVELRQQIDSNPAQYQSEFKRLPNKTRGRPVLANRNPNVHKDLFEGKSGEKIRVYSMPLEKVVSSRAILANNPSPEQVR